MVASASGKTRIGPHLFFFPLGSNNVSGADLFLPLGGILGASGQAKSDKACYKLGAYSEAASMPPSWFSHQLGKLFFLFLSFVSYLVFVVCKWPSLFNLSIPTGVQNIQLEQAPTFQSEEKYFGYHYVHFHTKYALAFDYDSVSLIFVFKKVMRFPMPHKPERNLI